MIARPPIKSIDEHRRPAEDEAPPARSVRRPVIGVLWGDFPWAEPPRRLGPLLSWGVVARLTSQALRSVGTVLPYMPPPADAAPEERRAALAGFLRSIDLLWADVYPASASAIVLRHELGLPCRALLLAGGAMPKGAEAMLLPWRDWLRPGDGLLFTCEADREIWRRLTRRSRLREWVAPCGVDDAVFAPRSAADRGATRRRHGLPPAAPLLLYVGRLNIQKNLHGLLRLFAAVRGQIPDSRLVLVGEEDSVGLHEFGALNTGYVASLRALAAELGLADAVTFLGPLFGEELARVYAAADLLVNLSFYHRENFGLAQAEAQACGTPVVCSAWGGFTEVVRHGETGYLVEAVLTDHGIRVDWATAAEHAVALLRDPARRSAMGRRAAAWARERFGLAALGRSLGEVVAELARPVESERRAAYLPSPFARRYEAHKRACGWYADEPRAMFAGRDYRLYERLLGPYATRLARDLSPEAIQPDWRPYFPAPAELDPIRRHIRTLDPVWPQLRYCRPLEWETVRRIDGQTTIGDLADALAAEGVSIDPTALVALLRQLHIDGLILFRR